MTGKDKQNHIFQKSKSYEISITDIYIGEDREFIIHVFYQCTHQTMKSILNVKKTSNLIKGIYSHKICSEIKSQQVIKTICHSVPKTFIRILLFHFIKSLSTNQFHVCFQPINFMCAFSQLISCVLSPNQFHVCFQPINFMYAFNQSISWVLSTNQFHGCF